MCRRTLQTSTGHVWQLFQAAYLACDCIHQNLAVWKHPSLILIGDQLYAFACRTLVLYQHVCFLLYLFYLFFQRESYTGVIRFQMAQTTLAR